MTKSSDSADIRVHYLDADTPTELFTAAGRWAAEHDGGFEIEAITWTTLGDGDEHNLEMAIYYEPT